MRRFDEYLPYVPSKQETWLFISSIPDLKQKTMVALLYSSGLRIGELCRLRYQDVDRKTDASTFPTPKTVRPVMPSSGKLPLIC